MAINQILMKEISLLLHQNLVKKVIVSHLRQQSSSSKVRSFSILYEQFQLILIMHLNVSFVDENNMILPSRSIFLSYVIMLENELSQTEIFE